MNVSRRSWWERERSATTLVFVLVALVLILGSTLSSQAAQGAGASESRCLGCYGGSVPDMVANLLLFVPLGFAFVLWRGIRTGSALQAIVVAGALSAAIEIGQGTGVVDGRVASVLDLAFNTIGAALGASLALALPRLLRPTVIQARVLFGSSCVAIHMVLFVSGWALLRAPHATQLIAQKSTLPFTTGYGWFERSIPSATVDGTRFENRSGSGAIIVSASVDTSHELSVRIEGHDRRSTFVPMLFVHSDGDANAHLIIGQRSDEYGLYVRVNSDRFGMRMPLVVIANPAEAADRSGGSATRAIEIDAAINPQKWKMSAHRAGESVSFGNATLHVRPSLAWMLVTPVRGATGLVASVGTMLFVLILTVPVFYLATIATAHRAVRLLLGSIAAASALVIPAWWLGLSMPGVSEGMGIVLALAVSWFPTAGRVRPECETPVASRPQSGDASPRGAQHRHIPS